MGDEGRARCAWRSVPSDIENGQCVLVRRDTREKQFVTLEELATAIPAAMEALAQGPV